MANQISPIHDSLLNGQRAQMTEQIKEYGEYEFFADYLDYLKEWYPSNIESVLDYFSDCTISYNRIKNR